MAQEKKGAKPLGVALEEFRAGVSAVVELRDSGKLLIFVSPQAGVRFIVDSEAFAAAYEASLGEQKPAAQAAQVESEVADLLSLDLSGGGVEGGQQWAEFTLYAAGMREMEEATKGDARKLIRDKLSILEESAVTEGLRQRVRRLGVTRSPALEDLDVEIVSEKTDNIAEEVVPGPLARLTLRCSDKGTAGFPARWPGRVPSPVAGSAQPRDFAVEVDETDMELLLRRLREAKAMLSKALERGSKEEHHA